jgi:hypothetical protein
LHKSSEPDPPVEFDTVNPAFSSQMTFVVACA